MMSRIAPRVQRTSLVSAAGGNWKCIPRSVPFVLVEGHVRLRDHRLEPVLLELVLAERPREEAAVVLAALEVDDEGARELGLGEDHDVPSSGRPPTRPLRLSLTHRTAMAPRQVRVSVPPGHARSATSTQSLVPSG